MFIPILALCKRHTYISGNKSKLAFHTKLSATLLGATVASLPSVQKTTAWLLFSDCLHSLCTVSSFLKLQVNCICFASLSKAFKWFTGFSNWFYLIKLKIGVSLVSLEQKTGLTALMPETSEAIILKLQCQYKECDERDLQKQAKEDCNCG